MKGKLSLVIALVIASLAVGISAAIADPGLQGAPEIDRTPAPDWFERAAAAEQNGAIAPYVGGDWFERAAAAGERDVAVAPYVDAFERPDPTTFVTTTSPTSESGTDIAWAQIGIAFGVGLLLALGLVMAVRFKPNRPLAQ